MKKQSWLATVALALLVVSCAPVALQTEGTVTIWSNRPDPELQALAAQVPGLVVQEAPRDSGWVSQLQQPSSAPDLIYTDLARDLTTAFEAHQLVDLSSYLDRTASRRQWWPGITQLVAEEKRPYFFPTTVYLWRLFYHADVLKAAGVEVPTSLADLEKAFATLKARGVVPLALGSSFGWPALALVSALDLQLNGAPAYQKLISGTRSFKDASLLPVYTRLAHWRDQGWIDPASGTQNWPEAVAKVTAGEAAFTFQPASALARFRSNPAIQSIALPSSPGQLAPQLAGVQGFVIRQGAPAVESALALADRYLQAGVAGQVSDPFRLSTLVQKPAALEGVKASQAQTLASGAPLAGQLDRLLGPQASYDANQVMAEFFAVGSTLSPTYLADRLEAATRGRP